MAPDSASPDTDDQAAVTVIEALAASRNIYSNHGLVG